MPLYWKMSENIYERRNYVMKYITKKMYNEILNVSSFQFIIINKSFFSYATF